MPPRKRARLTPSASTKTSPEAETSTPSPAPRSSRSGTRRNALPQASPEQESSPPSESLSPTPSSAWAPDPWTAAQETALFKALIRHKPTGMHKHFHMLSISSYLHTHLPAIPHDKLRPLDDKPLYTRIPAIWDKLDTLYDLAALDERQDAYLFPPDLDAPFEEFHLPGIPTTHGLQASSSLTNLQETDPDEAFFAAHIWARRFPNPELEADMDLSPEPELLPFRRRPDGAVEALTPASAVRSSRKSDVRPAAPAVSTPGPAPASAARRSNRRDASTRASGTPMTDMAAEEEKEEAEDGEEEPEEELEDESVQADEQEVDDEEGEGENADKEIGEEEEEDEEEQDEEEEDDDEDELGDRTSAPAARSTRSSARVRRR